MFMLGLKKSSLYAGWTLDSFRNGNHPFYAKVKLLINRFVLKSVLFNKECTIVHIVKRCLLNNYGRSLQCLQEKEKKKRAVLRINVYSCYKARDNRS